MAEDPQTGTMDPDLDMWLISLERWWKQTGNPLHVWEAIARCSNTEPSAPIPAWCVPYLADAARNITNLKWQAARRTIPSQQAAKRVGAALGVARQGFNAFAQVQKDNDAMRYALNAEHEPKKGGDFVTIIAGQASNSTQTEPWAGRTIRRIKAERNVETNHAAKAMLRRGRKLVGLDEAS